MQVFENPNSKENVTKPDFDISSSIDTAKELLLSKPQSSAIPDIKKSNESKLVSYEICFLDFYFSSVKNGWLCKIYSSFSHGNAGNRAFVDKPGKLGEHTSARFSDHLNSNRHILSYLWKTSSALKKCPIEMPMSGKWQLIHLYSPVKLSVKVIVLFWNASLK